MHGLNIEKMKTARIRTQTTNRKQKKRTKKSKKLHINKISQTHKHDKRMPKCIINTQINCTNTRHKQKIETKRQHQHNFETGHKNDVICLQITSFK